MGFPFQNVCHVVWKLQLYVIIAFIAAMMLRKTTHRPEIRHQISFTQICNCTFCRRHDQRSSPNTAELSRFREKCRRANSGRFVLRYNILSAGLYRYNVIVLRYNIPEHKNRIGAMFWLRGSAQRAIDRSSTQPWRASWD